MKRRPSQSEITDETESTDNNTTFSSSNDTQDNEEEEPNSRSMSEYQIEGEACTEQKEEDDNEEEFVRDVNNYDVLLLPPSSKNGKESTPSATEITAPPVKFASGNNHIGNNRFIVTLNIYREAYIKAILSGSRQEMEDIESQVVDTICNQVVPAGRFLEKASSVQKNENEISSSRVLYRDLGSGCEARIIVRRALMNPHTPMPLVPSSTNPHPSRILKHENSRFSVSFLLQRVMDSDPSSSSSSSSESENEDFDDEEFPIIEPEDFRVSTSVDSKKRRRRSSLLRRSIPDIGISSQEQPEEEQAAISWKHPNRCSPSSFQHHSNYNSSNSNYDNNNSNDFECGIGGIPRCAVGQYDVLLLSSSDTTSIRGVLSTDNIGNNRVRMMIEMRRAHFHEAHLRGDISVTNQIAVEIVRSVHNTAFNCSGKFLHEDPNTELWVEVEMDVATDIIRHCLIDPSLANVQVLSCCDQLDHNEQSITTPLHTQNLSTTAAHIIPPPNPALFMDDVANGKTVAENRLGAAARAAARTVPVPVGEDVEALRSMAVQILMKRGQKNAMTSNLKLNQIEEIQKHFAQKAKQICNDGDL